MGMGMITPDALAGKVALVTGGGRGIGAAVARGLAAAGAAVCVVAGTDLAAAEAVAQEICDGGGQAIARQADVADEAAANALVAGTIADLGGLDILVNNAGVTRDGLIMRMSDADWDSVMNVNLKGAFHCTRAAIRGLIRQRSGRIINVTSVMGISGNAGQANYSASKAGLIGLTKATAKEVGSRGITVNAVAPGWIQTRMTAQLGEELAATVLKQIPLARLGTPEDIAGPVVFLCTEAAGYITGQVLVIDGGLIV